MLGENLNIGTSGKRIGFALSTIHFGSSLKLWFKLANYASQEKGSFFIFPGSNLSNLAGGETYSFSSDSFDEFSFFDAGDQKYYIRINSNWYQVEENIDFFSDNRKLMQII